MNVDEIATQALALDDPARRQAFLLQACGENNSLRQKVESLLAALEMARPSIDGCQKLRGTSYSVPSPRHALSKLRAQ